MENNNELKFDDSETITNIDEIAKEAIKIMDNNVFDFDVDYEITKKAHIVDEDGEIFSLDDVDEEEE